MDKGGTELLLSDVFAVALNLETEFHENQGITGQAFNFTVEACDGYVGLQYAGACLWNSEEAEGFSREEIEKAAREELNRFVATVSTLGKANLEAEKILGDLVETINACGGLTQNHKGEDAPVGDTAWVDLATVYLDACQLLGLDPKREECE